MPLQIPKEQRASLKLLARLPDEAVAGLRTALTAAVREKGSLKLSADDIGEITGIPYPDLNSIVDLIIGLNHARAYAEMEVDEILEDSSKSLRSADASLSQEEVNRFKERLKEFLTIDDIALSAKTNILRYEFERTVHDVRILTDLRPIFGSDAGKAPVAVVITHTLKIGFHHGGRRDEIFVALDESDLRELKEVVERAERKAKSIRATLAESPLKLIDLQ